jgi:hypothetical protein
MPSEWDPEAHRWRHRHGPILADDGFVSWKERRSRRKPAKTRKPAPKPSPPAPSWADRSIPPGDRE